MKTLVHYGLVICLLIPHLQASDTPAKDKVEYRRLEKTNERARGVVEQLETIKLQDVAIAALPPSAALGVLRGKVLGEKGGGVINLVIRGSEEGLRVTIKADKTTYSQVIDDICAQTGQVWSIEFNEATGAPILVIKKKKEGQQAEPSNR
jgi:hypothetical protein